MNRKRLKIWEGKWALVTGATSGIGESLASILAQCKTNLVLVGRNQEKLFELLQKFKKQYKIEIEILAVDLSQIGSSEEIFNFCTNKGIDIDILLNNAGFAIRTQDETLHPERVTAMLQVMVVSLTELCNRFIPLMKKKKQGYILNVSSIVGCFPAASTLTYCASKRYIIDFSRYLHFELKNQGIHVTCLLPGPTLTNFPKNNQLPIPKSLLKFYISSNYVAYHGLIALIQNKISVITGGVSKAIVLLAKIIPSSISYRAQKYFWVKKRDRYD